MPYDESPKQAPAPGTPPTAAAPTATDLALIPPLPPETAAFDYVLSAVIDRLMVIEDRLLQVEDALLINTADFVAVKALVEELLP
jgi:hypothetical protein